MTTAGFERQVVRLEKQLRVAFGQDLLRLRLDAGITRRDLARAAGINDSYLGKIQAGEARPSSEVSVRLGLSLGTDLSHRLYPRAGPSIRDRHQAPIEEGLLGILHPGWQRFAEIAVHRPARGWIDLGLHAPAEAVFVAGEIQSELNRIEQLFRWSETKAESVPSWDRFGQLGPTPTVCRLPIIRDTRTNRATANEYRRLFHTTYPANPFVALDSLVGTGRWPGTTVLWATREHASGSAYRIVARA
ncbi:MAG TPA: helix-turn-helix transcriptional regulator [Candidatus Limnocylindrales bacterium]|nr:helix-turn-helix transcriptional regulator [Candidatus Limnocylindrales bacterium]